MIDKNWATTGYQYNPDALDNVRLGLDLAHETAPKLTDTEKTVTFAYKINDNVRIVPLNLVGRVVARCDNGNNDLSYRVIYWADGKRNDEWLNDFELSDEASKV